MDADVGGDDAGDDLRVEPVDERPIMLFVRRTDRDVRRASAVNGFHESSSSLLSDDGVVPAVLGTSAPHDASTTDAPGRRSCMSCARLAVPLSTNRSGLASAIDGRYGDNCVSKNV